MLLQLLLLLLLLLTGAGSAADAAGVDFMPPLSAGCGAGPAALGWPAAAPGSPLLQHQQQPSGTKGAKQVRLHWKKCMAERAASRLSNRM
jgi:hypothetical protein